MRAELSLRKLRATRYCHAGSNRVIEIGSSITCIDEKSAHFKITNAIEANGCVAL